MYSNLTRICDPSHWLGARLANVELLSLPWTGMRFGDGAADICCIWAAGGFLLRASSIKFAASLNSSGLISDNFVLRLTRCVNIGEESKPTSGWRAPSSVSEYVYKLCIDPLSEIDLPWLDEQGNQSSIKIRHRPWWARMTDKIDLWPAATQGPWNN